MSRLTRLILIGALTGTSVTGGAATHLAASGRHLLLLKGGMGVRVLAAATAC